MTAAGLTHELVTVPGVDHAFFDDTGPRFDGVVEIYDRTLSWFEQHLV